MKGLRIRLVKGDVEIRTVFVTESRVAWAAGDGLEHSTADYGMLLDRGWNLNKRDDVNRALRKLEDLWDAFKWGKRLLNEEFHDIVKLLRNAE